MILGRRKFLGVLAGAIAAPIVVRPGLLMPVRSLWAAPRLLVNPIQYASMVQAVRDGQIDPRTLEFFDAAPMPNLTAMVGKFGDYYKNIVGNIIPTIRLPDPQFDSGARFIGET